MYVYVVYVCMYMYVVVFVNVRIYVHVFGHCASSATVMLIQSFVFRRYELLLRFVFNVRLS